MEPKDWTWIVFLAALIFIFSNVGTLILYGMLILLWKKQGDLKMLVEETKNLYWEKKQWEQKEKQGD